MECDVDPTENCREKYSCNACGREFRTRIRLKRHVLFCQPDNNSKQTPAIRPRYTVDLNVHELAIDYNYCMRSVSIHLRLFDFRSSGTTCLYVNCNAKFYHRNRMLKHMAAAHNFTTSETKSFVFPSMEHFWTWKETEEERTYSYFSKRTGNHKNTATYHCQRDGPPRTKKSALSDLKSKRHQSRGSIKANIVCLAYIKTTLNENGSVSVLYYPSHNHPLSAMDFLHHPLSRATQLFIKEKLELGYTPKQIADELLTRQNASGQASNNNMTKNQFLHMVNKLDRIRGFLDRQRKRVRDQSLGQTPPRLRKSRKVVLEEQFEKSRLFLKQSQAFAQDDEDSDKVDSVLRSASCPQASANEGHNASDDDSNADDGANHGSTADAGFGTNDCGDMTDDAHKQVVMFEDCHEVMNQTFSYYYAAGQVQCTKPIVQPWRPLQNPFL